MKTVSEIRRMNLERLISELGTLESVAFAGGSSAIYLSQVRHQAIDKKTGKMRQMGSAMARRLDKGTAKPVGWMDRDHSADVPALAGASPAAPGALANQFSTAQDRRRNLPLPDLLAQLGALLDSVDAPTRENAALMLSSFANKPEGRTSSTKSLVSMLEPDGIKKGNQEQRPLFSRSGTH